MREADPGTWTTARVCERRGPKPESAPTAPSYTDRGSLDRIALLHDGEQRDDSIAGKIDLIDALALLLQDHALHQRNVLEMRRQQRQIFRGKRRQKQIAPAPVGAIEFHPQPFLIVEPVPQIHASAPTTRPSCQRHGYATWMELVCAVSDKDAAARGSLDEMSAQHSAQ